MIATLGGVLHSAQWHKMTVQKFINHSKKAIRVACKYGWLPGARYTNLRDVRNFDRLGFLDIHWKEYDFDKHVSAAKSTYPMVTVARDIERRGQLAKVLDEAYELLEYAETVVIVPKPRSLSNDLNDLIPSVFRLGYSVPTKYGGTKISPVRFKRPVHLLGGRPDIQRQLATIMEVASMDCNRFTLDAAYGKYFDGERFCRHPKGGYEQCLRDSVKNINKIWATYR